MVEPPQSVFREILLSPPDRSIRGGGIEDSRIMGRFARFPVPPATELGEKSWDLLGRLTDGSWSWGAGQQVAAFTCSLDRDPARHQYEMIPPPPPDGPGNGVGPMPTGGAGAGMGLMPTGVIGDGVGPMVPGGTGPGVGFVVTGVTGV